jgi:endoglucanase
MGGLPTLRGTKPALPRRLPTTRGLKAVTIAVGVVVAIAGLVVTNVLSPPPEALVQPAFSPSTGFYVNPDSEAAQWVQQHPVDPRASEIGANLASQPQATWLTDPDPDSLNQVGDITGAASAQHLVPALVPYVIPNRDCGGASSGGARDLASYQNWIDRFAQGLGSTTAVVILEPDSLANIDCLSPGEKNERYAALSYAVQTVHRNDPHARVYYDGGNSQWQPASVMAQRLELAGASRDGDGIALNVSNYNPTGDEIHYGNAILRKLGSSRLRMIIDTSRNGNGAAAGHQYCDPLGRRVGVRPTAATGVNRVDAYLWIKHPGQADGCRSGAGDFMPDEAFHESSR